MKHYIEISLIDDTNLPLNQLWSKLYTQLHLALVEIKDQNNQVNVGISFPEYRFYTEKNIGFLGTKLRLFAKDEKTLQQLNIQKWLERLLDDLYITPVQRVPDNKISGYAIFSRKQVKTSAERMARHRLKHHNDLTFDEAVLRYQSRVTQLQLPYIQMNSLNNGHPFRIFIEKRQGDQSLKQIFSTYGLSVEATVPDF